MFAGPRERCVVRVAHYTVWLVAPLRAQRSRRVRVAPPGAVARTDPTRVVVRQFVRSTHVQLAKTVPGYKHAHTPTNTPNLSVCDEMCGRFR